MGGGANIYYFVIELFWLNLIDNLKCFCMRFCFGGVNKFENVINQILSGFDEIWEQIFVGIYFQEDCFFLNSF